MEERNLWKELWNYDPNALVVVNGKMEIQIVNPSFCRMFLLNPDRAIGMDLEKLLGDVREFRAALANDQRIEGATRHFPAYGLTVREVGFPLKERDLVAVIFHDITNEERQRRELEKIREQAAEKVNDVVENQMRVVQEVAGLLGESLATARVSLHELMQTIEKKE